MKRLVQVYARDTYLSGSSGSIQLFRHDASQYSLLGQAKTILLQVYGYRRSSTARATIKVYESSIPGRSPSEVGVQLGSASTVTVLRSPPISITGPFQGMVEITLEIDDTAAATQQEFDLEIDATLILGE